MRRENTLKLAALPACAVIAFVAAFHRASLGGMAVAAVGLLAGLALAWRLREREREERVRGLDAQVAGLNAALEQAGRRNDELLLMAEMLRAIDGLGSSRDAGPA